MITKGFIKKGQYFDSVTLMIISKDIKKLEGIIDSSIVMGTNENKSILKQAGLYCSDFDNSSDAEILIAFQAESETAIEKALLEIDNQLINIRKQKNDNIVRKPKSIENAKQQMPDANLVLISVAGKYATNEAVKALDNGINVMMFSDNVSIEDEISLKLKAREKGLLVMGPDCGTAIINGVPLAFANVVNSGNIGIVAASGTGLQEVSSIISNLGAGISQAIGTGGRDVKKDVGGIMFIEALKALNNDAETKVIVLISKPPHESVLQKISEEIKKIKKPVVGIFIGANPEILKNAGAIPASNLEEAAIIASSISKGESYDKSLNDIKLRNAKLLEEAKEIIKTCKGKYLRGLFSGGTLCDETQLIMKDLVGFTYSNTPLNEKFKLTNVWVSQENTIIDLGDDEFTAGKPHPMIDFSLRCKKIIEEAKNPDVAVILLDIVLGFGSNLSPLEDLIPALNEAKKSNPSICIISSITGTDNDPQNRASIKTELEKAGVIVKSSNVEASILASNIIKLRN